MVAAFFLLLFWTVASDCTTQFQNMEIIPVVAMLVIYSIIES